MAASIWTRGRESAWWPAVREFVKKATAIFRLSPEAVPENTRSIPSESGIGRKGWFHFLLVWDGYKIWAIMVSLAFLNLLLESPLHWEGHVTLPSHSIESLSNVASKTNASRLKAVIQCLWWKMPMSWWKLSSIYKYLLLFHTHSRYQFKRGMGSLFRKIIVFIAPTFSSILICFL